MGAGTRRIAEVIAGAVPKAEIVASEPAETMRAVLTSRVAADADLRARVTVTATTAPALARRAVLRGGPVRRRRAPRPDGRGAWSQLAGDLPAVAPVVVELMGVHPPGDAPAGWMLREQVGEQTYEWWTAGTPDGPVRMRFDTRGRCSTASARARARSPGPTPGTPSPRRTLFGRRGWTLTCVGGEVSTLRAG
ncbi:MAG: hypothetical protein ABS81_04235 [Pseudonocardia sp. SCN 72-86]|nr:MAG: hypothetical protein ABS81_04235 [Pseudonocardia sp. SCN 72-86]